MKTTLFYNGNIMTMTEENAFAQWIYIVNDTIRDIGMYEGYLKYLDRSDRVIDLQGKTVLPGIIDSHVFLMQTGINKMNVDLFEAQSLDDVYDLITERAKNTPRGEFIRASNFDEFRIKERRFPNRYELDDIVSQHPVWINRIDIHTSMLNSLALNKIKLPHNLPGVQRRGGVPTGIVSDHANAKVRKYIYNQITDADRRKALSLAADEALQKGITTVVAVGGGFVFGDMDTFFLREYCESLPIDVVQFFNSTDFPEFSKHQFTRGGSYFLDGSFGSRTAAVYQPYNDDANNYGTLYFTEENLTKTIEQAHLLDIQTAVHAIGDRAIDVALDAYEQVLNKHPKDNHRHRIEYFELPSPKAIKRVADLGLVAMMVPVAIDYWGQADGMYDHRIGIERNSINNPFRNITDAGIIVASGSDSDISDMNPFLGVHATVNSPQANRQLSLFEALRMATYNSAYGIFEEHLKGTLEINKQADLIVLDRDLRMIESRHIKDIKVELTMRKGDVVYERAD